MIPNNILTSIIVQTFHKEVGKFQIDKDAKALLVSFKLQIDHDKEDGYRHLDILVYAPQNYVGVFFRQRSNLIATADLEYDDDGDGQPKPGKNYIKEATAWERIAFHDSGWIEGIDRILKAFEDRILSLNAKDWFEVVDVPEFVASLV